MPPYSILIGVHAAVLAALSTCSCSGPQYAAAVTASAGPEPVAVAAVTRQDLARDLELAAEFRPFQEIEVHAKLSGYLKAIHVDVGDFVRQGQLIAELEVPELAQEQAVAAAGFRRAELEIGHARSEVARAEASLNLRRLSYDRLSSVVKARPNLVAQQEVDDAAARLQEEDARLRAAKATLAATEEQARGAAAARERVETMAGYLRITAPFSGVITARYGDPGAMIQAGTASHTQARPVVRLSEIDRLRLVLPVPESMVPRIRTGAPVEARVDSLNRVYQGRISRFTGRLNASTRTMETEVDIPNPRGEIKPGMYGVVSLKIDRREDALAVPVQAVSGRGASATVLMVNGEKRLEERIVSTGVETPSLVEIVEGVRERDMVVLGNRSRFKPGMLVQPKEVDTAALGKEH